MDQDLIPVVFLFAIFGGLFVLIVAAGLWEKRLVQPFVVPLPGEEFEPVPAAKQANAEASVMGYTYVGLCHDARGKMYRMRCDFWIVPDLSTIALIGGGTIANLPSFDISLYSQTKEGRIVRTNRMIGEQDISGAIDQRTWPAMSFKRLIEKHNYRLRSLDVAPFTADTPLTCFFNIRRRQFDALVERGYAYYIDEERSAVRFTLHGAVMFYLTATWLRPIGVFARTLRLVRD